MKNLKEWLSWVKAKSRRFKILFALALLLVLGGLAFGFFGKQKKSVEYQTTAVVRGELIVSVTASGAVSSVNSAAISTRASGVVKEVYFQDGDEVTIGETIALIELDREGQQAYNQALSSYQSAQNSLKTAENRYYALKSAMFNKWESYRNLATSDKYENADGTAVTAERETETEFITAEADWLGAEAEYKNQENLVNSAKTALSSSWLSLEQASSTIVAPISGKISGLSLQAGTVLASTVSTSSSNNTTTTNKVASVITSAKPLVTINLTEIDISKVSVGDRATVTLDAFSEQTFTGKVQSIDKVGTVSSGVTAYPVVIALDLDNKKILPNMSASATILTDRRSNVLLIPASAVTTENEVSTVKILKDKQLLTKTVSLGLANDTQVEIRSGLLEGEAVITSVSNGVSTSSNTSSPFSITNRGMGGAMGGGPR